MYYTTEPSQKAPYSLPIITPALMIFTQYNDDLTILHSYTADWTIHSDILTILVMHTYYLQYRTFSKCSVDPSRHPCPHAIHQLFCHHTQDHSRSSDPHPVSFKILTQDHSRSSPRQKHKEGQVEFLGDRALEIFGSPAFSDLSTFCKLTRCIAARHWQKSYSKYRGQCSIVRGKNLPQCQNRHKKLRRVQKMRRAISCGHSQFWGLTADCRSY